MPAVPNVIQSVHVCDRACTCNKWVYASLKVWGCVDVCVCCQLPHRAANPLWLVPTGNWAQTGAKQTQEGNVAHGNPPSLSHLSHPPLCLFTNIDCFFASNSSSPSILRLSFKIPNARRFLLSGREVRNIKGAIKELCKRYKYLQRVAELKCEKRRAGTLTSPQLTAIL